MDPKRMEQGIRTFLDGIGEGFAGDDRERTPERVARAWIEDLVSGYAVDPAAELTWTPAPERFAGPVVVRGISFASVCVHHLLPFFGHAAVAYVPGRRLAGLSKVGRVVDAWARRLQTQEHLTAEVVRTLAEGLEARAVVAVLEAEHTCMTVRGVRKEHSRMLTVSAAGAAETDPELRRELLELASGRRGDPAT